MAASDIVTPSRENLRVGDVSYKRALSEAIFTKVAAQNNFINAYQTDIKEWKLNGSYSVASGITFYDGVASFFYNSEIVGVNFYNGQAGSSGSTTFDIIWVDANGTSQGSIFSTKPTITSAAGNNCIVFVNFATSTGITPPGTVSPNLSKSTFLEGESVYMVLDEAMPSAINCGITIFYRPIN